MLAATTVRTWYRVHKWTSLICTLFLLMLCITGLPLVFREEIYDLRSNEVQAPDMPPGTPLASLDHVVDAAHQKHPDQRIYLVIWDNDRENVINVTMASFQKGRWRDFHAISVDARTAQVLDEGKPHTDAITKVMSVLVSLHVDMFAGEPGRLFLGFMGLLFAVSIVTGVVVYGPFMRKLDFGTLRVHKAPRVHWLDLHNLLGIVATMWTLVVGITGMINTFGDLVIKLWEVKTLSAMMQPYKGKPPLERFVSLDRVLSTARQAVPDMMPYFISFPGGLYTTSRHFDVLLRGRTPFTSKLVKPALIDAETGALTATAELPWHLKAILLSQPLHFGDYGGLPLKIAWALFDVVAILVLISGLYLWLTRRKISIEERLDALVASESGQIPKTLERPV
jgi:uncharacterized iron-regulated membrane protein